MALESKWKDFDTWLHSFAREKAKDGETEKEWKQLTLEYNASVVSGKCEGACDNV